MASSPELAELLSRCALGDRQAFERLYRETAAQLFGLVLRIVKDQDLASDVLQEGYVKIWNHTGEFRPDKATAITWMGAIMRNQAIDQLRRAANRPSLSEPVEALHWLAGDADDPADLAERARQDQRLHACLDTLEEEQRQAMLLAYFRGLTHEELAQHLNRPLGTIKSWLRRGLLRLKKCLDELI